MRDRLADLNSGASTSSSTSASSSATSSTASLSNSDPDNQQQTSSSDNDNSQNSDAELLKIFEEISKSQTCSNVSKLELAVVLNSILTVMKYIINFGYFRQSTWIYLLYL